MAVEKHGWTKGKTFAHAVGLKAGPRKLLVHGEGTSHEEKDGYLVISEPNGSGGTNTVTIPLDNVAFIAEPLFLIDNPPKGS